MAVSTTLRKPLGIRATPKEHALIKKAAAREGRSVNSFVLHAALEAAQGEAPPKPRRTHEEIMKIVRAAQLEIRKANPQGRDLLEELIQERRREASNE
jgi:hypothetical protein